ncbi:MAG: alkaline phosphatase family protein [Sandaracinaceae bacterium]
MPQLVRALCRGAASPIPGAVPSGRDAPKTVVSILIDGFGWSYFERFASELPFLRRVVRDGVVSKLTAQFPSTTAAQITTFHTGAPVGESGVFEWFYFEPELDAIFAPLLHSEVGVDALIPVTSRAGLFPARTLYEELTAIGVDAHCHQPRAYTGSPYSCATTRGATTHGYRTFAESLVDLRHAITASRGPSYHALYYEGLDSVSHGHGPGSEHVDAELRMIFAALEAELGAILDDPSVCVLLTADHGHTAVSPERTIYLDEEIPELEGWLRTSRDGRPLVPAGSSRDMFIYVRPESIHEAKARIETVVDGRASVWWVDELVGRGLFGRVTPRLSARLGDLLVLPHDGEMVWWSGGGRFTQQKRGHHGGLSAEELEIPLLAWRAV